MRQQQEPASVCRPAGELPVPLMEGQRVLHKQPKRGPGAAPPAIAHPQPLPLDPARTANLQAQRHHPHRTNRVRHNGHSLQELLRVPQEHLHLQEHLPADYTQCGHRLP